MSIKICVITPISHLKNFARLGEMDMSLSHLVLENPIGPYVEYYKEQRELGRFVILDNSAFELEQQGKGLDPDPVLDACELTNPNEVIATDCLFDGPATIESTKRFIQKMLDRGVFGKYQIMGVAQGKTKQEWWDCFKQLLDLPIDTIGLSKLAVPVSYFGEKESSGCVSMSRIMCVEDIAHRYGFDAETINGKRIHLLGGDNWLPREINQQKRYKWIRSNDSSAAVWYGRHNKVFNDEGKIRDIILNKPDLENKDPDTSYALDKVGVQADILENIIHWHLASKD